MGRHAALATQTTYPWRTVTRTVFQAAVSLAAGLPVVLATVGVGGDVAGVATVLAVAGAVTRVMALPFTEAFLRMYLPWLAAAPSAAGGGS